MPTTDEELLQAYRLLVADVHELTHVTRRISDEEARDRGSSVAQWHLLSVISDGPRTVPSIAQRLGISRQAVQRVGDDLVAAGHVTVTENPRHARSPLLTITATGRRLQADLYRASGPARQAAIEQAGLSRGDLAEARRVLRALLGVLAPGTDRGAS